MNINLKLLLGFLVLIVFSFAFSSTAEAAFININSKGEIIWRVLGVDSEIPFVPPSDIKIKSVGENKNVQNSQVALNNENGRIILNGIDVTNFKDTLIEIEARGDANDIKISQVDGRFVFEEKGVSANTDFPITIDPVKNELKLKTASGERIIKVWPYEAVLSLKRAKLVDKIKDNKITLSENSKGELQYLITGEKSVNIFNVATVSAPIDSSVSVSNGEVLKMNEPYWLKFFGFLFK